MSLSFLLVFSLLSSQGFLVKKLLPSSYEIAYSLKKSSSKESQEKLVKFLLDKTQNNLVFTPGLVNEVVSKDLGYQEVISDFKENVRQIRNKETSKQKSKSSSSSKKVYESFAKWKTSLNFKKPYSSYHYAQEYLTKHKNDQLQELANYWQKDALQLFLPKLNNYWSNQKNIIVDDIIATPNQFSSTYESWIDFLANYLVKPNTKWQDYFVKLRDIDKTFYEQKRKEGYTPLKIQDSEYDRWRNANGFEYIKNQLQNQKSFDGFPEGIKKYQSKWDFYNFLIQDGNDQQYLDWKKSLNIDQAKILLQYNEIKDQDYKDFIIDYIDNNFKKKEWESFDFSQDTQAFNDFHKQWKLDVNADEDVSWYDQNRVKWFEKDQIWNSFKNYISNLDSYNVKNVVKWFANIELNWRKTLSETEKWKLAVEKYYNNLGFSIDFFNEAQWWYANKDKSFFTYFSNEYKKIKKVDLIKDKDIESFFNWIQLKYINDDLNSKYEEELKKAKTKLIEHYQSDNNNEKIKTNINKIIDKYKKESKFKNDFKKFLWKWVVKKFFNQIELNEYIDFNEDVFVILKLNKYFESEFNSDTKKEKNTTIYKWVKLKWKTLLGKKTKKQENELKTKFIKYYINEFEDKISSFEDKTLMENNSFKSLYQKYDTNSEFINDFKEWIKNEIQTKEKDYKKQIESLSWSLKIASKQITEDELKNLKQRIFFNEQRVENVKKAQSQVPNNSQEWQNYESSIKMYSKTISILKSRIAKRVIINFKINLSNKEPIFILVPLLKNNKEVNYDPQAQYQKDLWLWLIGFRYRNREEIKQFPQLVKFFKDHSQLLDNNKIKFSILSSKDNPKTIEHDIKFSPEFLKNFRNNYVKTDLDKKVFKSAWKSNSDQFKLLFSSLNKKVAIDENYDLEPFKKDITSWLEDKREYNGNLLKIKDTFLNDVDYEQKNIANFNNYKEEYKKSKQERVDLTFLVIEISQSFANHKQFFTSFMKDNPNINQQAYNQLLQTRQNQANPSFQEFSRVDKLFTLLANEFKTYLKTLDMKNQEIKEYTTKKYKNSDKFLKDFRSLISSKNLQLQKVLHNWYINKKEKLLQSNYQNYRISS